MQRTRCQKWGNTNRLILAKISCSWMETPVQMRGWHSNDVHCHQLAALHPLPPLQTQPPPPPARNCSLFTCSVSALCIELFIMHYKLYLYFWHKDSLVNWTMAVDSNVAVFCPKYLHTLTATMRSLSTRVLLCITPLRCLGKTIVTLLGNVKLIGKITRVVDQASTTASFAFS